MESEGAFVLRENTGTSGLELAVRTAVAILAEHDIPHLIAGGLAVQENGYFRVTLDADIIVPDVLEAVECLTADLAGPFAPEPGVADTVRDRKTGVQINFLPAGRVLRAACRVPFPTPSVVRAQPHFVTLGQLLGLKLDSWSASPTSRIKDKADVVELIKALKLPRGFPVTEAVRPAYQAIWDALDAEQKAEPPLP